ncbi:uncharacterized protein LOC113745745 [Larimichthys crocea]|uniref:uncharacterized protein LOC113745745 n=1 Tax=Larimichthys crocea TaxID=215358 RepID=UPI000F5DEF7B|nr:uncharacterized protein LOC113745745 [Larimichthys crocea]
MNRREYRQSKYKIFPQRQQRHMATSVPLPSVPQRPATHSHFVRKNKACKHYTRDVVCLPFSSASTFRIPRSPNPHGLKEERECYYCHQVGHVIANCVTIKRREQSSRSAQAKGVGVIKADRGVNTDSSDQEINDCFKPFVFDAFVSLTGESTDKHPIQALRDTACSQSVILASALPFSDNSACHYSSVLRGVDMSYVPQPVHRVHVQSSLVTGFFPVVSIAVHEGEKERL